MRGVRVFAVLLFLGGLLGLLAYGMMAAAAIQEHHNWTLCAAVISIGLFGWAVVTAIALWRRAPSAYRRTKVLLARQVPAFTAGRVAYELSIVASFRLMIGNTTHNIGGTSVRRTRSCIPRSHWDGCWESTWWPHSGSGTS